MVVHVGANPAKDPGPANDIDASAQATYGPGGLTAPPVAVALEISTADLTLGISPTTQSIQKRKDADVVVSLGNNGPDAATGIKTITINLTGDGEIRSASGCTVNGAGTQAVCAVSTDLASGSGVTRTLTPTTSLWSPPSPSSSRPPTCRSPPAPSPRRWYTSDVPVNAPVPTPTAPPDSFAYTATGTLGATELFNVAATAKVKVRNQLPIGLDTLVQIFPGTTGANVVPPLDNDLDGNTVADPVLVGGSPFVFDDRGRLNLGFRLKIQCIGPEPALDLFDPLSGLPPVPSTDECTKPGMKTAGQELTVAAPADSTGNVSGSITATLVDAGAEALRQLEVMIDSTVTGTINFGVIVVDNYGGAAWSRVSIKVPDTPPELLPVEQTVPKNSPPVEVFDTVKGTRDINREVVIVSSVTDPAHGTATISADRTKILYEPDRDYVGPDSLDLNVSDASGVGSNSARMSITVKEPVVNPVAGAGGGESGAGASPAGSLPATGGDPLALTGAGGLSLLAGVALVQASRRRQSLPLLAGARHLRR